MDQLKINLKNSKIVIVTHRSILPCIPGDDLKKFLLDKGCSTLLCIKHPLLLLKESYKLSSKGYCYTEGRLSKILSAYNFRLPEPLLYIKDFIYTLIWITTSGQKYDLYFGMNNLNALTGLVLKSFGRVKKVVYYSIDLYPQRFENKLINWMYHKIDRLCVKNSDEIWNVSPFISKYRTIQGMTDRDSRQFVVPIGVWLDAIERVPLSKVQKTKLVYIGHLVPFRGIDLAIRALPYIVKMVPGVKLEIVGGGEQLEYLKQLSRSLNVQSRVKFHGFLASQEKAIKIISDAAVALAPYRTTNNPVMKNADPAKIKDYLALGLPVVTTNMPAIAKEIQRAKCGFVVKFTPESLANAVVKLLSNEQLRKEYSKNALQYVKQFDWNVIFAKNISRLLD